LFGRPERKKPLRRHRHGWKDNIGTDVREIGLEGVDWTHLSKDRDQWWVVVNMAVNFGFHKRRIS
jgi:hypothetical protein